MKKRFFLFAILLLLTPFLVLTGCGEDAGSGILGGDGATVRQPIGKQPPPTVGSAFTGGDTGGRATGDGVDSAEVLTALVWLEKLENGNMRIVASLAAKQKIHILVWITHWAHPEDEAPFLVTPAIITIQENANFSLEFLPPKPEHWTRSIRVQIGPFKDLKDLSLKTVDYKTAEDYDIEEEHEFTALYRVPEGHGHVDFFYFPE